MLIINVGLLLIPTSEDKRCGLLHSQWEEDCGSCSLLLRKYYSSGAGLYKSSFVMIFS